MKRTPDIAPVKSAMNAAYNALAKIDARKLSPEMQDALQAVSVAAVKVFCAADRQARPHVYR